MLSLLIFIVIVIIVMALLIYAIQLLPLPSPPWIKQILMVLVVIIAVLVIVQKAGLAHAQQPTPIKPQTRAGYDPDAPKPVVRYRAQGVSGGWQRFKGATRCEQVDNVLSCDNGYTQRAR